MKELARYPALPRIRWRQGLATAVCLALAGCIQQPPKPQSPDEQEQQQEQQQASPSTGKKQGRQAAPAGSQGKDAPESPASSQRPAGQARENSAAPSRQGNGVGEQQEAPPGSEQTTGGGTSRGKPPAGEGAVSKPGTAAGKGAAQRDEPPPGSAGGAARGGGPDTPGATGEAQRPGAARQAGGAETEGERVQSLERRLHSSMGEFDERLQKEWEALSRQQGAPTSETGPAGGVAGASAGDGGITGDRQSPGGAYTTEPGATEPGGGDTTGDSQMGSRGSTSGATGRRPPDGSDDDVIARQLREAAEQETDPELKEKLWKEYRRYKEGAS